MVGRSNGVVFGSVSEREMAVKPVRTFYAGKFLENTLREAWHRSREMGKAPVEIVKNCGGRIVITADVPYNELRKQHLN